MRGTLRTGGKNCFKCGDTIGDTRSKQGVGGSQPVHAYGATPFMLTGDSLLTKNTAGYGAASQEKNR